MGATGGLTLADYREALDTALFPAVGLALCALPYLKKSGRGRLLFIASETVARPVPGLALSGFARIPLVRFAEALVGELKDCGVTVNVLAPSYFRTPPIARAARERAGVGGDVEGALREISAHIPLGRVCRPEEFAAVAAFLASDRASFVTGKWCSSSTGGRAWGARGNPPISPSTRRPFDKKGIPMQPNDEGDSRPLPRRRGTRGAALIWLAHKQIPAGWRDVGRTGTKAECLAYVDEVWTDMRPKSLREAMDSAAAAKA